MAAEKLTKHRLAQILLTLILLLVAFFWRTITYQELDYVSCDPAPKCSLFVNEQKITVTKIEEKPQMYTIYPIPKGWILDYEGQMIRNGNEVTLIPNGNKPKTNISLVVNHSLNIEIRP